MGMEEKIGMMAMVTQPRVAEVNEHKKKMESFLKQVHSWVVKNPPETLVTMSQIGEQLYLTAEGMSESMNLELVSPFSYEGGTFQELAEANGLKLTATRYDDKSKIACFYARATDD